MENKNIIITPKTKLNDLLTAYPHLEDVLIDYAPAFKKLKNPVLRKTIAKIATLKQVASVGNVKIEELINLLRKEVGQEFYTDSTSVDYNYEKPEWFTESKIVKTLDVREMLDQGDQPVNQVIADLKGVKDDEIYKIEAPFIPAPLIDKATSLGFKHWLEEQKSEAVNVFFTKK